MKRRYFNYSAIADILALTESLGLLLKTRLWLQIVIGMVAGIGLGIVVLATILGGIGVPVSGIAVLIGVDRILDMSRTLVNVTGDITACLVLDRLLSNKR